MQEANLIFKDSTIPKEMKKVGGELYKKKDKPIIICYHRRSKNKNGANLQSANLCCITSHKNNKNGDAAASEQRLFKNSEKPVICFHRRRGGNNSSSSTIRDAAAEKQQQQQQTHEVVNVPMGKKRKRMSVELLPDDIIHNEILTRLPAKYIVRSCRLVCKSWNSLLFNSLFVKSHLARLHSYPYKDDDDEDLIIAKTQAFQQAIHILSRTNQIHVPLVPPFYATFLGSINGLVCMSSRMENMFRFWNPAIAQLKQFFLPAQHPKDCKHFLGGFSWDHMQNDYKVVLVCHDTLTSSPSQLMIYSSNSATWTQLLMPPHIVLPNGRVYRNMYIKPPSTFVKGIPYWRYTHYLLLPGKKRRRKFISAFKFLPENNEFSLLPDLDSVTLRGKKFNIVNIKDCLLGMAYKTGCKDSLVDIYSLDEETHSGVWSKMYTIGPIDLSANTWRLSQCFKNGGEILINRQYCLVSLYDPKTKQTKVLAGKDDFSHKFSMCFSYTPSLVCVQGMVSIHQFLKNNRDNEISFDDLQAFN